MSRLVSSLFLVLGLLAGLSYAHDRPLLVVSETIEIDAEPAMVWNMVKRFDGLTDWHPAFAKSEIIKGRDGQLGAVRALTVKDGPTFTETLLALNPEAMAFTYDVIESPLPLTDYLSSMTVKPSSRGGSIVTWTGTFRRKNPRDNLPAAESDAGVVAFITGAYRGGLQNLKKVLEAK